MPSQVLEPEAADLDALTAALSESATPVDLQTLVHQLARVMLESRAPVPAHALGMTCRIGQRLWFRGRVMDVVDVRKRYNPLQGAFDVLDLRDPETEDVVHTVAGVANAPVIAPSPGIEACAVADLVAVSGPQLRAAILGDPRLASMVDVGTPFATATPVTQVVAPPPRHALRSSGLFSENVIAEYLDGVQDRSESPGVAVDAHLSELMRLWSCARETGSDWGTEETWRALIAPVLQLLGWQVDLPTQREAAGSGHSLVPDPVRGRAGAVGVFAGVSGESPRVWVMPQPWRLPLGTSDLTHSEGCSIIELMGRLGSSDGARWGIVTNGRQWRLYRASQGDPDVGCTAAEVYDVDLSGLLDLVPPDEGLRVTQRYELSVWWALFESAAYVATDGRAALTTRLKQASAAYARRITMQLRNHLLTSVLPEIAGGFVAYRRQHLRVEAESEATLDDIMRGSLGLVYRLLFVLYAESRLDLPLHHPDYRGQSLTTKMRWSVEQLSQERTLSRSTERTALYDALLSLFRSLEHGAPGLGLPSYSGGLFSPVDPVVSFIERHRLSDRVVARTLAALGRQDDAWVDYTALTARNLSSVADGLLENSLWVVEARAGQVALVSATGTPQVASSSPVPEYVGVSVVERAIEQVLAARSQSFAVAMDQVAALRRTLEREPAAQAVADSRASLAAAEQAARETLLDIKVVDPAVGAGVFLVAALDVIVDGVLRTVASYHRTHPWVPWAWDPICRTIDDARVAVETRVREQGLPVDAARLDEGALLAMLLTRRGLYGVDVSPSAIAAAQASVGVRAFVVGAPFAGVDNHIRCGDSLVGLRLSEVASVDPVVADIFADLPMAVATVAADCLGETVNGHAALAVTAPYDGLLDVLVSERYGNRGAYALVSRMGRRMLDGLRGDIAMTEEQAAIVAGAARLRAEHRFIHWDTAFPDVFLKPSCIDVDRPGFDVVVGSPPTDSELGAEPLAAGAVAFAAALSTKPQGPFAALAGELVRVPDGRVAFVITPPHNGNGDGH